MYDTARRVALVKQRRWSSPCCASGSEKEKIRKKTGRTNRTDTKRRRKANEETNTQHPAPMLHGADAAADNSIGGGRTDEYHPKVRREH